MAVLRAARNSAPPRGDAKAKGFWAWQPDCGSIVFVIASTKRDAAQALAHAGVSSRARASDLFELGGGLVLRADVEPLASGRYNLVPVDAFFVDSVDDGVFAENLRTLGDVARRADPAFG